MNKQIKKIELETPGLALIEKGKSQQIKETF